MYLHFTIRGAPRTKKNHTRNIMTKTGRMLVLSSKAFTQYESDCLKQILGTNRLGIEHPVNVKMLVYQDTKRKSDLVGFLQALSDILVKAGVLKDDNHTIIQGYDGSRVFYDKQDPRVEITITTIV